MKDMDILAGGEDVKTVEINGKEYKIATLNPYILGQTIGYIKDKKRAEIAETAKVLGETNLKEVLKATNEALKDIDNTIIDKELGSLDVMSRLVYFALKVYQPTLLYSDMGKLLTMEHIIRLTEKITEGITGATDAPLEQK